MAEDEQDIISADDEFEKLLQDFINAEVSDDDEKKKDKEEEEKQRRESPEMFMSPEAQAENEMLSKAFEQELADTFSEARQAVEKQENMPELGSEESELAQAFLNYKSSIDKLAQKHLNEPFETEFSIDFLYPNYKPSLGIMLSNDLVKGWLLLSKIFPTDQEKHIKRIMYEEYLARKERQRLYTEAVKKKNFPIDADRLISNYFRVAQKDVSGAFKALTTNPAIFAPIDFTKIKPRFFGLIKVTPKDGIRINTIIGNFLKKLKV